MNIFKEERQFDAIINRASQSLVLREITTSDFFFFFLVQIIMNLEMEDPCSRPTSSFTSCVTSGKSLICVPYP